MDISHTSTKAPMIELGEPFFEQSHKEQVRYLHKLASAMNHAADIIQKERDALLSQKIALEQQLLQAQNALGIQKASMINAITNNNAQNQETGSRIVELQNRVKVQGARIRELEG